MIYTKKNYKYLHGPAYVDLEELQSLGELKQDITYFYRGTNSYKT